MFWDNPIHVKVDVFCSFLGACFIFTFFLLLVFLGQQRCSKAAERDWTRVDRGRLRDKERNRISEQCQKQNRRVVRNNSRRNSPNLENRHVGICCKELYLNSTKRQTPSSGTTEAGPRVVQAERQRDDVYEIIGTGWFGNTSMGIVGVEYISRELFQVLGDLLCYL